MWTSTPRSAATSRALTRFTGPAITGARSPASTARASSSGSASAIAPVRVTSRRSRGSGSSWTLKRPSRSASATKGLSSATAAGSPSGMFTALDEPAVAERHELPGDVHRDVHLRLAGVGAEVRRDDDTRVLDEPPEGFAGGRLFAPDVDRDAGDVLGLERREEIGLVDDPAARAVH